MAKLKAGRVSDFQDSLAAELEAAMQEEWKAVKGKDLPSPVGEEDRKIMWVAIARGVLKFFKDHRNDIVTDNEKDTTSGHSHFVDWDYE